jgi:hypothetical protein
MPAQAGDTTGKENIMTRIGTGLGTRTHTYAARVDTTFRQLEIATTAGTATAPGSVVVLSTAPARCLDSAYTQGILIRNPSTTVSLFVGDQDYAGVACNAGNAATAWEIPPGQSQKFDVRDGSGLYLGVLAATLDVRVVGN